MNVRTRTPCCGHAFAVGQTGPIFFNPANGRVQCHHCGAFFDPPPPAPPGGAVHKGLLWMLAAAIAAGLLLAQVLTARAAPVVPVGTALVLAVDVSGSVDPAEYEMQREGIARAFADPAVIKAIWNQPFGRLAVTVVEWSDDAVVVVPWTILDDAASANAFAAAVLAVARSSNGSTALGDAILSATGVFETCPCQPLRRVIDVSGDGTNNSGGSSAEGARDLAVAAGIVVNGLPITGPGSDEGLYEFYDADVKGGLGGFVVEAAGFEDFARALRNKLTLEIAGVM